MSRVKFMNIARLMTTYKFEIEQLPDNLKCSKCKLVLKDACLVSCGCTFCRICIDDMIVSGVEFCTGVLEGCGESPLSCFVSDFRANNNISKLTGKCPHEGCAHECQLADMEEHLRECERKVEECLFRELGCTHDNLAAGEMNGHLQKENRKHSEILIETITKINDEVKYNRREIEMLKHELVLKDGQIRTLIDQMIHLENENKSTTHEKENLVNRLRILEEKLEREIDERRANNELDSVRVIELVDREIAELTAVIESNKDKVATEMMSVRDDIRLINQGAQSINQDSQSLKDDICFTKLEVQSIQALVGHVDAKYDWVIDADLAQMSWTVAETSDYFTGAVHPYKYQLSSFNYGGNTEALWIYLRIHPGANDEQLTWPYEERVVITVADKDRLGACRSISQQCRIDRPPAGDNWRFSEKFVFRHSKLIGARVDFSHGVRVSCMIVPGVS